MEIKSELLNDKQMRHVKDSIINASENDGMGDFRVKTVEYINDRSSIDGDDFFYDMLEFVRFLKDDKEHVAYTSRDHLIYLNAPGEIGEKVTQWDFIYDHECLHQLWDTFGVEDKIKKEKGNFNHYIMNIASDCVINDFLEHIKQKDMPDNLITPEYLKDNYGVEYNRKYDTQYTLYFKLMEKAEELVKDKKLQDLAGPKIKPKSVNEIPSPPPPPPPPPGKISDDYIKGRIDGIKDVQNKKVNPLDVALKPKSTGNADYDKGYNDVIDEIRDGMENGINISKDPPPPPTKDQQEQQNLPAVPWEMPPQEGQGQGKGDNTDDDSNDNDKQSDSDSDSDGKSSKSSDDNQKSKDGKGNDKDNSNSSPSERAQQSADKAQQEADKAKQAADDAQKAADEAKKNGDSDADEKQKAADDAKRAADDAQKAADDAQKAADDAKDAEKNGDSQDAENAANDAEKSAGDAEQNADDAQDSAEDAGADLSDFENRLSDMYADGAKQNADDAQRAADEAKQAAADAQKNGDKNADKKSRAAAAAQRAADEAKSAADDAQNAADEDDVGRAGMAEMRSNYAKRMTEKYARIAKGEEEPDDDENFGEAPNDDDDNEEPGEPKQNKPAWGNDSGSITGISQTDLKKLRENAEKLINKYKNKLSGDLGHFISQCKSSLAMKDTGLRVGTQQKAAKGWNEQLNADVTQYVKKRIIQKQREYKKTYSRVKRGSGFVKFGDVVQPGKRIRKNNLIIDVAFYIDKSGSMDSGSAIKHVFDACYTIAESLNKMFSREKVVDKMEFDIYAFDYNMHKLKYGERCSANGGTMPFAQILEYIGKNTDNYMVNIIVTDAGFDIDTNEIDKMMKMIKNMIVFVPNTTESTVKRLAETKYKGQLFYIEADSQFTLK